VPKPAQLTTPAPAPPPVLPQMISTPKEIKPPIGTNNVLGRDEIRYCLSESIRMGAMKEEVNRYVEAEVEHFNATVQDYNSHCAQFRYRKGSLESARREVEVQRTRLEIEGTLRIKKLRGLSSSTRNRETGERNTEQTISTQQNEVPDTTSSQEKETRSLSISALSQSERASIKSACSTDKYVNVPAAYNNCLQGQLARIRR
jgi:hypothetical protein